MRSAPSRSATASGSTSLNGASQPGEGNAVDPRRHSSAEFAVDELGPNFYASEEISLAMGTSRPRASLVTLTRSSRSSFNWSTFRHRRRSNRQFHSIDDGRPCLSAGPNGVDCIRGLCTVPTRRTGPKRKLRRVTRPGSRARTPHVPNVQVPHPRRLTRSSCRRSVGSAA